jgi:hypothetical protein
MQTTGEPQFSPLVRWLLFAPALAVAGAMVAVLGGAFIGLSLGLGPEDTGGAIWVVSGLVPVLALGWLIAFVVRRRGYSRTSCRAAFFAFTTPSWVFVMWLGWKVAEHALSR